MFTGIVTETGVVGRDPRPSGQGGVRLEIAHSRELGGRLELGASLAVAGVCLTIIERRPDGSTVELSPETLSRTSLGDLRRGSAVNLEPALRLGDALGGHWVQGHVDGTGRVTGRRDLAAHRVITVSVEPDLEPYLVEKGSVAVDGVSLTVAARSRGRFDVALIPHTLEVTTLGALVAGARVNLEVDILAKYVESLMGSRWRQG